MIIEYLKSAIKIILFNSSAIDTIKRDDGATKYAIAFLAFTFFHIPLYYFLRGGLSTFHMFLTIIGYYAMICTWLVAIHLLSKYLLKSKSEFLQFVRVYGLMSIITLLLYVEFIPMAGRYLKILLGVWSISLGIKVVKEVYDLRWLYAIGVSGMGYIAEFIMMVLIEMVAGGFVGLYLLLVKGHSPHEIVDIMTNLTR